MKPVFQISLFQLLWGLFTTPGALKRTVGNEKKMFETLSWKRFFNKYYSGRFTVVWRDKGEFSRIIYIDSEDIERTVMVIRNSQDVSVFQSPLTFSVYKYFSGIIYKI